MVIDTIGDFVDSPGVLSWDSGCPWHAQAVGPEKTSSWCSNAPKKRPVAARVLLPSAASSKFLYLFIYLFIYLWYWAPHHFALVIFQIRSHVFVLCWPGPMASHTAEITGMHHHSWLFHWDGVFLTFFPRLNSNHDPLCPVFLCTFKMLVQLSIGFFWGKM
jgi:hypothetical protein